MEDINMRVKEIRTHYQLSQVDFAKNIGVTNAHISKIEKGGTIPSEALIKLICKEYSINERWLKEGILPMFIDEVESDTEKKMVESTTLFNTLLNSDSYILRNIASELNFYFAGIVNVVDLEESQILPYLTIIRDMLMNMNYYNSFIKEHLITRQEIIEDVYNAEIDNYKKNMEKCINEFSTLLKNKLK